jgi:uncharacterized membrane protein YgcG
MGKMLKLFNAHRSKKLSVNRKFSASFVAPKAQTSHLVSSPTLTQSHPTGKPRYPADKQRTAEARHSYPENYGTLGGSSRKPMKSSGGGGQEGGGGGDGGGGGRHHRSPQVHHQQQQQQREASKQPKKSQVRT